MDDGCLLASLCHYKQRQLQEMISVDRTHKGTRITSRNRTRTDRRVLRIRYSDPENIAVYIDPNVETGPQTVHGQPQEPDLLEVGPGWEEDEEKVGTGKLKEGVAVVEEMGSGLVLGGAKEGSDGGGGGGGKGQEPRGNERR